MASWLTFPLLLFGAAFLQIGFGHVVAFWGCEPDFSLLVVLHLAFRRRFERVYGLQWLVGLSKDLLGGGGVGLFAGTYLLAGVLLSRFRDAFFAESRATQALVTFVVALQVHLLALFFFALDHPHLEATRLFSRVLGTACYTAVVAPFVLGFLRTRRSGARG